MKPVTAQVVVSCAFLAFTVWALVSHQHLAWAIAGFVMAVLALSGTHNDA